ncbi:MAG: LVIVD repeat-containing protein [Gemmatimonadales bacterium]
MATRLAVLPVLVLAASCVITEPPLPPPPPPPPPGAEPELVGSVPIPPTYGIHDTYVRDGLAFVSAWNAGLIIYDVGDGRRGGSPANPVEISRIVTNANGVPGGAAVHNAWWFHNPVRGEQRYVFVGQEGPASLFSSASGDLHVVDVSDLANPMEVASLRIPGAGVHNVWMDESAERLYAAWYNGGVVVLDVSGTLAGDLTSRIVARVQPGGAGQTFVWGVMLANGALWANDIVSGFWKLDPTDLSTLGGGGNVPDRWGSDLWVRGDYAYTGTWGGTARGGNYGDVLKIWRISGAAPALVDSVKFAGIRTVSDVEVSDDGTLLVVTKERDTQAGFSAYDLTNPAAPTLRYSVVVPEGLHTGTLARIGGERYLFAAKNPPEPALQIYRLP